MISDYYKLDDDRDHEYTMTDLAGVEYRDDKNLEAFWNSWNRVLTRVNTACVQELFIERMFFDQVKKSHVLKEDIAHYNMNIRTAIISTGVLRDILVASVRTPIATR